MAEREQPFTLGQWKQYTTYKCKYCKFDTTEEEVAWAHYQQHLRRGSPPQETQPAPSPILVADKRGREVQPAEPPVEILAEPEPPKRKARKRTGG